MKKLITCIAITIASSATAMQYHVGDKYPLKTISAAAELAQPGDTITVHAGIYREWVNPPRGGASGEKRITYQAAPGAKVIITGSEPMKGWEKVGDDTWKVTLPNTFFGNFNPYSDRILGDWFNPKGRHHHTGAVYLNGHWLIEAAKLDDALKPAGKTPLWFGRIEGDATTIWAQFPGVKPNDADVEINVRKTVFSPGQTGINYITVRGFTLRNAATNWAPPSAGQIGLVSAYWCKGWIIENNDIAYSKCSGIALGKYSDEFDNTNKAGAADPYTACVRRALNNGWNKQTVGSHIVRNNRISHCEQTGIVGSMGGAFSAITGNEIHDIYVHKLFSGYEMAGIKLHAPIDVVIRDNHIFRVGTYGIWLDWMTQGAQVTGNLLHDNHNDIFSEVNHGPYLVANNILLSGTAIDNQSNGGAFCHNLMTGNYRVRPELGRSTPVLVPHGTQIASMQKTEVGDDRWFNNLLIGGSHLTGYDNAKLPVFMAGNVFLKAAQPSKHETDALRKPDFNAGVKLEKHSDCWHLIFDADTAWRDEQKRNLVTTELLGAAVLPNQSFVNPDGVPLKIDTDYFGGKRNARNPFPGPFEITKPGKQEIKVWPK